VGNPAGFLLLATVVIVTPGPDFTAVWMTGYAVVARAKHVLLRPRVRRALDAVTGLTLVAFGARLASE
jgi:threonine/homoserine/homoserine lactone efflux protein